MKNILIVGLFVAVVAGFLGATGISQHSENNSNVVKRNEVGVVKFVRDNSGQVYVYKDGVIVWPETTKAVSVGKSSLTVTANYGFQNGASVQQSPAKFVQPMGNEVVFSGKVE